METSIWEVSFLVVGICDAVVECWRPLLAVVEHKRVRGWHVCIELVDGRMRQIDGATATRLVHITVIAEAGLHFALADDLVGDAELFWASLTSIPNSDCLVSKILTHTQPWSCRTHGDH